MITAEVGFFALSEEGHVSRCEHIFAQYFILVFLILYSVFSFCVIVIQTPSVKKLPSCERSRVTDDGTYGYITSLDGSPTGRGAGSKFPVQSSRVARAR
jgi:hypothetical protein